MRLILTAFIVSLCLHVHAVDYRFWRGPHGTGLGPGGAGLEMVDDAAAVKVLWQNDVELPIRYCNRRSSQQPGGYNGCAVADGRVFYSYYEPSGDVYDTVGKGDKAFTRLVDADDIVLCIDAKTGKTLWKKVFSGKGVNQHALGGLLHTYPAIIDDRVIIIGTLGRVYCLSVKDGSVLWEDSLGTAHQMAVKCIEVWKADERRDEIKWWKGKNGLLNDRRGVNSKLLAERGYPGVVDLKISPPIVAEGVLVVPNSRGGLRGFHPQTGELAWPDIKKVVSGYLAPTIWRHDDKDYVLMGSSGVLSCIDPVAGSVLWRESLPLKGLSAAAHGDLLVTGGSKRHGVGISGFRITTKGVTKLWQMEPQQTLSNYGSLVWTGDVVYGFVSKAGKGKGKTLLCIDPATGKILSQADHPHDNDCVSPVSCGNRIMYGDYLYDASPAAPRLLGKLPIPRDLYSSDPFTGGMLFVRSKRRVVCLDLRKGQ